VVWLVVLPQIFGPGGFFSSFFLNPSNILYALGFLIPLILLYLIKPKPVNVAVPSLMFILNDMGKSNVHRFFRTIFRDILFLIQALAIILLALALAKPYINVDQESLVRQSIVIIDTSASTRAFGDDRFGEIQTAAIESLASDNIVIVSQANAYALEENGDVHLSAGGAKSAIDDLQPTDMDGDLPTALDIATAYVGPDSKVTIVSDFVLSSRESQELIEAKFKVLRSKGALVEIKAISSVGRNIGIIDASLNSQNATVDLKIQNFNDNPSEIGLEYNGETIALPKNVLAPEGKPGSFLSVSIPLAHGKSEILLTPADDFEVDNHYYVSIPDRDTVRVLLISNDQNAQTSKLIPALQAAGDQFTRINVAYGTPPKIPDLDHEIYIIKDVNTEFVLPGAVKQLREKVEGGAVLVVYAQQGLFAMDTLDLLPVSAKQADPLAGKQELIVNSSLGLMRGLSYIGQVNGDQLLRVQKTDDAVVHAAVATNDGMEPVIAHKRIGKGVVIYYGIKDQRAVDLDPQSYAVVWGRIVDYSIPDSRMLNVPTGAIITSPTKVVATPLGKKNSPVVGIRSGFYQAGSTTIAANLYPLHVATATETTNVQYESVISKSANVSAQDVAEGSGQGDVKVPNDLSTYVIIAGILVMLFELLYVKLRGDL
jgi:hypothetical protein